MTAEQIEQAWVRERERRIKLEDALRSMRQKLQEGLDAPDDDDFACDVQEVIERIDGLLKEDV